MKDEVRITEEDATAKAYMSEIRRARCTDLTLGQVIHGLVWELSFHGGPQEQMEVSEDLKRQVAEVDAGTVELMSADDVFEPLYKPGCDAINALRRALCKPRPELTARDFVLHDPIR